MHLLQGLFQKLWGRILHQTRHVNTSPSEICCCASSLILHQGSLEAPRLESSSPVRQETASGSKLNESDEHTSPHPLFKSFIVFSKFLNNIETLAPGAPTGITVTRKISARECLQHKVLLRRSRLLLVNSGWGYQSGHL